MVCGRITTVVENLDVELASRSKTALIDISIVLPRWVHILVAGIRRTRRYCKSTAQMQVYLHSISSKRLGLYICALPSLPLQVILRQLGVRRLFSLGGHRLYRFSAILGLLRSHDIRHSVNFSNSLRLPSSRRRGTRLFEPIHLCVPLVTYGWF